MNDDLSDDEFEAFEQAVAEERRRELAVEHLLFGTLQFIEGRHPGLLDHLESTIPSLGDNADDDTKDDEAVREIARRFLKSLRSAH